MRNLKFKIGSKTLSELSAPFVIAEIGINHNGSLKRAIKMVDYAVKAKCDAVKFQTINVDKLMIKNSPLASYQKKNNLKSMNELILKYNLSYNDFIKIKNYCDKKKITFLSTPFDEDSAIFLNKLKVHAFKVSSSDNDNLYLLNLLKKFNKPLILSTGMSNFNEIKLIIKKLNLKKNKLCILHCISNYPTKLAETQIGFINKLKQLGYPIGYSDHSIGQIASIAAVSLGSIIVEKHITLNRKMEGPDHYASLDCKNLITFVSNLKDIKSSLNVVNRHIGRTESKNKKVAKKTIYFSKNLKKNHIIKSKDLEILRPRKNGKSPIFFKDFLGKKLKKKVKAQQMVKKNYFFKFNL